MKVAMFRQQPVPGLGRGYTLSHPEYPIEQQVTSPSPALCEQMRDEFVRGAARCEGALFTDSHHGLRVLGQSETALKLAVDQLTRRLGEALDVGAPRVRYALGTPTLEPYMTVVIDGPDPYLPLIQKDFARRNGRTRRVDQRGHFVLEGEAPLASLIGYTDWLRALTDDEHYTAMWLSRYRPVPDDGPQAA
jgi:predicted membrane GTPase involved in stress response